MYRARDHNILVVKTQSNTRQQANGGIQQEVHITKRVPRRYLLIMMAVFISIITHHIEKTFEAQ